MLSEVNEVIDRKEELSENESDRGEAHARKRDVSGSNEINETEENPDKEETPDKEDEDLQRYIDIDQYDFVAMEEASSKHDLFSIPTATAEQQRLGPPLATKGMRNEDSVLFSLVGQNILNYKLSTSPFRVDREVADALSDIHTLSLASGSAESDPSRDAALDELEWKAEPFLPSVIPLVKKRRWGSIVPAVIAAGFVALATGFIVYTKFSIEDKVEETLAAQRVEDLQNRYDKLISLLITAKPESLTRLNEQFEETKRELAFLRAEQKASTTKGKEALVVGDVTVDFPAPSARPSTRRTANQKATPQKTRKPGDSQPEKAAGPTSGHAATTFGTHAQQDDDLDDILGISPDPSPVKASSPPELVLPDSTEKSSTLPERLSRSDVKQGMSQVAGRVKACGKGEGAVIMTVTILKTGQVSKAYTTGEFAGSETGRCVAQAVQTARFPQARYDITVKYTFIL